MNSMLLLAMRVTLGAIWLYNGLWQKIIQVNPEHLAVVAGLPQSALSPRVLLTLIGVGETVLGLGVWSGVASRFVSWFQIVLLIALNTIGIFFSGAIPDPAGLIAENLPLLLCMFAVALHGPGSLRGRWR